MSAKTTNAATHCGYVAIVGAPNAGKSTLLNAIVGAKVAIVTPKVQTTRSRIHGIVTHGATQIIFVDTPGIFAPKRRLEKAMVAAAWSGANDADLIVFLVDAARGLDGDTRRIIDGFKRAGRSAILALNKIDTVAREKLLGLTAQFNSLLEFDRTFMISALNGDGVSDLIAYLAERLPNGPWLYPEDQLADISERVLAAEITREQVFLNLHQELPYASTVETEAWRDLADGSARIEQVIYVARASQKPIVLGKNGRTIKAIGAAARAEMEQVFDRRIHLFIFVKVSEHWLDDPERYRAMGLDPPR
jgi:GTP-binding protein Era